MDEFQNLPWSVLDVGSSEETYALNMPDYRKNNPMDVFFCNLSEIDPLHLEQKHHKMNHSKQSDDKSLSCQFIDPRTGIEIPSHECIYRNVDLENRNIFLKNFIEASSLQKHEHIACLNVLQDRTNTNQSTSTQQRTDQMLYELCAINRTNEKTRFLEKLREHYLAKLSKRFHHIPPAINHFITEKWKKQLIMMYRRMATVKYRMGTAISFHPNQFIVKTNTIYQEHLGNVSEMKSQNVDYMWQSSLNLMTAYNQRKINRLSSIVDEQIKTIVQQHDVDFIIPISIIKLIVSEKKGSTFCMSIKESTRSNIFNSKREITIEKPLPPITLSGNERYKNGAKYLLNACLNQNALRVYSHSSKTEIETHLHEIPCEYEHEHQNDIQISNNQMDYKISKNEEFLKNYPKSECSYENMTFTVFDVTGIENSDTDSETFRILVTAKQNAYKKNEHDEIEFVNYSPKIEYQAEYGAETMTKNELIQEWCDLYFRPNTCTERVRFDCVSGKVIHRQSVSIMDVENEIEQQYGIETQQILQRLWHVLQTLSGFPVGDYLLQCDAKNVDYVKVYEKSDSADSLSIERIFKDLSFELNPFDEVQWQPIDDRIVTEIHEKYQILPGAFPHIDYLTEHNVKTLKDESIKYKKGVNTKRKLPKIQPKDDSMIVSHKRNMTILRKNTKNKPASKKKQLKRLRYRERKKAIADAHATEAKEHEAAKNLLATTIDQYITPSGQFLNSINTVNSSVVDSSIANRTRKQSKSQTSSEKAIIPDIRRSNRRTSNTFLNTKTI